MEKARNNIGTRSSSVKLGVQRAVAEDQSCEHPMSKSRAISLKEGQPEKMGLMADKLALTHGLRLYRDDLSRVLCIRHVS